MRRLKDKAVRYLASCAEGILACEDADGHFWPDAGRHAQWPTDFQQFAYYPLALLYTLDHPENPWRGNARVLDGALRSLRGMLEHEDGAGNYMGSGHDSPPRKFAGNWRSFSFLRTWELLRSAMDRDLESACEASLRRALGAIAKTARESCAEDRFARNHNVRNHPIWELTATLALAKHFGDAENEAFAKEQFERAIAAQHSAGIWLEHDGPVMAYMHMTLSGLSHYHALTGSTAALHALDKCLRFLRVFYWPNGHPCEVLDGRVRYTGYMVSMLPAAWARFPEGRATLHLLLDRINAEGLHPGYQTHGSWLGLFHMAQFVRDLPPDEPAPDASIAPLVGDGVHGAPGDPNFPARMLRSGPWSVALCGFTRPELPGTRWALDFQAHLSVFHEKHGVLIGGGHGKRQAPLSLFTAGSRPLGLPCLAEKGSVETTGAASARLTLDYSGFRVTLDAEISGGEVRLTARADLDKAYPQAVAPAYLQLPFLLKGEGDVVTGSGKHFATDMQQEISAMELGAELGRAGRFAIRGFDGARALVLFKPYNTHWKDAWYHESKNLGIVAQPLSDGQARTLTVRAL